MDDKELEPCETCKWYDEEEIDIHCRFCRGEYVDRWEARE